MRIAPALTAMAAALALAAPALGASDDPLRPQQYGLDMIEADAAHQVSTGSGAVVAVIDTGVLASHEDLQGRLLPGRDIVDNDATPQDGNGHGTHVSGIVAATANNGRGIEGVAPGARVLPVRVLGDDGSGTSEDVAKGIDYAVAQHADVINLSLGDLPIVSSLDSTDPFVAAIDRATAAGVVVVAAAGNDSLPICEQPSVQGEILCVGAVDKRGMRSFFSSSGNITAPGGSGLGEGEDILSTWNDGKYFELAGTSQATPHVAGVAALLVSRGVRGKAAVDRILATATDAGTPGPDPIYGAGIVNAKAAVAGLAGGTAGGGGTPTGSASAKRRQRIRTALRHGVRIVCRPAAAGRCSARVRSRGHLIARGASKRVAAGRRVVFRARVTKTGRRILRRSRRRGATLTVTVPGAAAVKKRLVFVR